jgi:hypothetical protein
MKASAMKATLLLGLVLPLLTGWSARAATLDLSVPDQYREAA